MEGNAFVSLLWALFFPLSLSPKGFFFPFASCLKCKKRKKKISSCFPLFFDYKIILTWSKSVPVAHPLLQLRFLALYNSLKVFNLDLDGSGSNTLFPQPILAHLCLFLPRVAPTLGVPPNADPTIALLSDTAQQQLSSCPYPGWDLALLSLISP